ncbi:tocopherol cyclase family protein [Propionibacterium sp.]|uniref:tocopherol cyclase family protein n=1 Tax=Propionibacterium sp. TaxID=1977903 RepID=UPI0039ED9AAC
MAPLANRPFLGWLRTAIPALHLLPVGPAEPSWRLGARRHGYRVSGADLPFGHPERAHGVAMEGYYWRFTDPETRRVIIALIGVQTDDTGRWALAGLGTSDGFWRQTILPEAEVRLGGIGARAKGQGASFFGTGEQVVVDLGPDARLDVRLSVLARWPSRRPFGGSSWFQSVPGLNQYWHPWLLGARASGTVVAGGKRQEIVGAQVYGEKNWGKAGFPDSWWWGQAQGFSEPSACVAFAGGQVVAGPLHTEVTALVVRLPDGRLLRLGNPLTSPVRAQVSDGSWELDGRSRGWTVSVHADAPLATALILPVPLVGQRRAVPGDIEHLAGNLRITVSRRGRQVWAGQSRLAGLEHGGLERAAVLAASRS